MLIEAAIDSIAAAEGAVREGATRLEVCNALDVGGLTPSRELLRQCLTLGVPCMAMARPRAGGFMYTDAEVAQIISDAQHVLAVGAHGIVFGCLHADRTIDDSATRQIVAVAGGAQTVFHRAFDDTPDAFAALETLLSCGVTRVLTSGHSLAAIDGAKEIAALVNRAAGRITILPGGAVRGSNVRALVAATGVTEVHARAVEAGVIAAISTAL